METRRRGPEGPSKGGACPERQSEDDLHNTEQREGEERVRRRRGSGRGCRRNWFCFCLFVLERGCGGERCGAADGRGRGIRVNSMPLPGVQTLQQGAEHTCSQGGTAGGLLQECSSQLPSSSPQMPTNGEGPRKGRCMHTMEYLLLGNTKPVNLTSIGIGRSRTQKTRT